VYESISNGRKAESKKLSQSATAVKEGVFLNQIITVVCIQSSKTTTTIALLTFFHPFNSLCTFFIFSAFSHTPQVNGTSPTALDQNPTIKIKPFPHPTTSFPLHGSQEHVFLFLPYSDPVGVSRVPRLFAGRGGRR